MAEEIGIVIGTSFTSIFVLDSGIVLHEPTAIAFVGDPKAGRVLAVGKEAAAMRGKTPDKTTLVYPVSEGFIADADACRHMLAGFLKKIFPPRLFSPRFRVIAGIPTGLTLEERRIYEDVFVKIGLSNVTYIENILLSAVGMDLPIHTKEGALVINIGGGVTELAALSLGGIVSGCGVNVGGIMMDHSLADYLKGGYGIKVGYGIIEKLKCQIGSLLERDISSMDIGGIDISSKAPVSITVTAADVKDAIFPYYLRICDAVESLIKALPPEMSADLIQGGLHIAGGAGKILGLQQLFQARLKLPVAVSDDAEFANILGAGKLLSDSLILSDILMQR